MTQIASEAFTGTDGTTLESLNALFSKVTGQTGSLILASNRIRPSASAVTAYYTHSATPPSADYSVSADIYFAAGTGDAAQAGVVGRYSTTALNGYRCMVRHDATSAFVALHKHVSGTPTQLGSNYTLAFAVGDTVHIELRMSGSTIAVHVNGSSTPAISVTDTAHSAAGKAGVHAWYGSSRIFHIDNFSADTLGGDVVAPTLTSATASATGQTTASGSVSTDEANGTLYYLASANATETVATVKAGSSQAVSATGAQNVSLSGLAAATSYYLHFVHTDAAANDSAVATSAQFTTSAADSTPPTLTGPTATATGQTTASGTVSTNEATGTLYWLASANATETAATVKAGSSQAVSATGTQGVSVTGLTAATAYYLHYVHRDAAGNDSTVSTSAQFTTNAAVVLGIEVMLYNGSTAQASLTGIRALWWDGTAPTGAPDFESTTETTDATGLLAINIESVTSLSVGQNGFLLLYKLDGTDHRDSLVFAGQVAVSDIS